MIQLLAGIAIGDPSGGAELFGLKLARRLDRNQFTPAIFGMWQYATPAEEVWRQKLSREKIPVGGLYPISRRPALDFYPIFARLWRFTGHFQPDIINSHSQRGDLLGALIARLHPTHPRAVRTVHIDQPWLNRPYMDLLFNRPLFPWLFDTEVAISQTVQQKLDARLMARLLGKQSVLCYNGIDAALFAQQAGSKLPPGLPPAGPRIGIIGSLIPRKRHTDLLQALRLLDSNRPVHLVIIGTGELEAMLRKQARTWQLAERVHFLGSRDDVFDILPHLDVVVSASLREGLPTVLLEAMAFNVPVIATDISGSRDLVQTGQTGLLIPPRSPTRLAEAIQTVLDNPAQTNRMRQQARELAAQFTIQNAVSRYARLYQQITRKS